MATFSERISDFLHEEKRTNKGEKIPQKKRNHQITQTKPKMFNKHKFKLKLY